MKATSPLFKSIKSKRTFEKVSNEIKALIIKGVIKPGDRLPPENEIAQQFGVGRQTVREALRVLELSGLISIQRGGKGGPVVKNTTLMRASSSLKDAIQMESISIEELTSARLEIEKVVLSHVIDNANDQDILEFNENIKDAYERIAIGTQAFEENVNFHILLAKSSKNQVFVLVIQSLMEVVADFLGRLKPNLVISQMVIDEHVEILQAIIRRDKEEASVLLEKHLLKIKERVKESYNSL